MLYAFFTIILAIGVYYAHREYAQKYRQPVSKLIMMSFFVFWFFYFIEFEQYVAGNAVNHAYRMVAYILMNTFLPLGYMYVCERASLHLFSSSSLVLVLLALINLCPNAAIFIDGAEPVEACTEEGFAFYCGGKMVLCLKSYQFVQLLQALWVMARSLLLFLSFRKRDRLELPRVRYVFALIAVLLLTQACAAFVPQSWFGSLFFALFYFTVHLLLALTVLHCLSRGYMRVFSVEEAGGPLCYEVRPQFAVLKERFEQMMETEKPFLEKDINFDEMVVRLGTNRTYLSQLMKDAYRMTFSAYVNMLRVNEAKRVLRANPDRKLEDVALSCGFSCASTFARSFKNTVGITPKSFKDSL